MSANGLRVALGIVSIALGTGVGAEPLRAVILTGQHNHEWQITTPALLSILQNSGRFAVEVTEDPAGLTAEKLADFDVIISNWTNWPAEERVWGAEAEAAVLDFVRAGKGFALFHAASACFSEWPEYQSLIGATWAKGETGHGAIHKFPVTITDRDHPIMRGLRDFTIRDELWHKMGRQPDAHVLATAFSATEQGGTGSDEPVVFVTRFGEGRGFNLVLGHDATTMADRNWQLLMLRGAEWAATGKVTITRPVDIDGALDAVASYQRHGERSALMVVEGLAQDAGSDEGLRKELAGKLADRLATDATDDAKAFFLQKLSLIGRSPEVSAIAALLGDEALSVHAVGALERIPGEAASAALRSALGELEGAALVGVINALGERRDAKAVGPLAAMLGDEDEAVVRAALDALGSIGGAKATEALLRFEDDGGVKAWLAEPLLKCAESLVAQGEAERARDAYTRVAMMATAGVPDELRAAAMVGLFGTLGEERAEWVTEALTSGDPAERLAALRVIREAHKPAVAQAAAKVLGELPVALQVPVVHALAEAGDASVAPAIAEVARLAGGEVRLAGIQAVADLGDAEGAAEIVAEALKAEQDADARRALVAVLGSVRHVRAMEVAASLAGDETLGAEAAAAAIRVAEGLSAEHGADIQAAMERVVELQSAQTDLVARARTVLYARGRLSGVTESAELGDTGPDLALDAVASSLDGIDSDGAASGDQAAIDGNPATYWDEVDNQPAYRLRIEFPEPREVSAVRIMGWGQLIYAPKDFEIICDGKVVRTVTDAWYVDNRFAVTFPLTRCKTLELHITGRYGASPAIRELEVFGVGGR